MIAQIPDLFKHNKLQLDFFKLLVFDKLEKRRVTNEIKSAFRSLITQDTSVKV